jgi:hypothetical protein
LLNIATAAKKNAKKPGKGPGKRKKLMKIPYIAETRKRHGSYGGRIIRTIGKNIAKETRNTLPATGKNRGVATGGAGTRPGNIP